MVDTLIVFVETHEKFAFHLHAKEYSYFLTNLIYIYKVFLKSWYYLPSYDSVCWKKKTKSSLKIYLQYTWIYLIVHKIEKNNYVQK